jgi:ribosomal protein S3
LGYTWYADKKDFSKYLIEDKKIRDFVKTECFKAGVSRIEIERKGDDKILVAITTGKPGIIIGRQGSGIEDLKKKLNAKFGAAFSSMSMKLNRSIPKLSSWLKILPGSLRSASPFAGL